MKIMIKLSVIVTGIMAISCNQDQRAKDTTVVANRHNQMYVEVKPFETNHGWGYNIYVDKKLYISQNIIPGVKGTNGFKTKEEAMKVGGLAVHKMSIEKRRPVITTSDLSRLHIDVD